MAAIASAGCGDAATAPLEDDGPTAWDSFTVDAMQAERQRRNTSFLTVLDRRSFRMGLLHAKTSTEVGLIAHRLDAIYFVARGAARISSDSVDVDVEEGHVVFVRGDVEHRIRNVQADLDLVVIFRIASLSPSNPDIVAFTPEEMTEGDDSEEATFELLLTTSSVGVGMYQVPKGEGDDILITQADELKLVVEGTSRFDIGTGGIQADPGTIAFIPDGIQHQLRKVADALDVLVVWER